MAKLKYEVTRPWSGKAVGDVIEVEEGKLHPSLRSNVRQVRAKGKEVASAKDEAVAILKSATAEAERIVGEAHAQAEAIKAAAKK